MCTIDRVATISSMQSPAIEPHLETKAQLYLVEVSLVLSRLSDWAILLSMLEAGSGRAPVAGAAARCVGARYLPDEGRLLLEFAAVDPVAIRRTLSASSLAPLRLLRCVPLSTLTGPPGEG